MMNDGRPVVGIDVGSSLVSVVVGSVEDDRLVGAIGLGLTQHVGRRVWIIDHILVRQKAIQGPGI